MKVLVTGAYGFIGSHLVASLMAAGHRVVGCGRNPDAARGIIPHIDWIKCDFNRDTEPATWTERLQGVDAVINCAGILQGSVGDDIDAIHRRAPMALFEACCQAGIRRVIQISALGVDDRAATEYAASKRRADDALMATELDWIVLRPSLVYGRNCYGGTALFRGLAALPFAIPVPGQGLQRFQPIHMSDLVRTVLRLLEPGAPSRLLLMPVGPEAMTLRDILSGIRQWLAIGPAPIVSVPMPVVRLAARLGDAMHWIGMRGSFRSTAIRQMERDNIADAAPFIETIGFTPTRFADALCAEPSGQQDRWHARLYFLRPLLRIVLGLFWLASGVIATIDPGRSEAIRLLNMTGFEMPWSVFALWAGVATDIVLGALVLIDRHVRTAGAGMVAVTLFYVLTLGILTPELWLDPLGPLVKAIPLIPAVLVMMALQDDR